MYAQCPECLTVYALDATTLAQAQGNVGCGQCGATFNALTTLTQTLPEDDFGILPAHPSSPAPPILMMAAVHEAPPQQPPFEAVTTEANDTINENENDNDNNEDEDEDEDNDAETVDEAPVALPSFVRRSRTRAPRHRPYWALGCLLLALILGAQLVWAKRIPLTANATTRPWLKQACSWFGCALPLVRDTSRLQLLSRDVRPHPTVPGALLISATLRNNAPFAQPYPVISITLSDLNENPIAMRRFRPSEYITNPGVRAAGLAPGATAAVMFEVKDPGRNAVAFQFGFQ